MLITKEENMEQTKVNQYLMEYKDLIPSDKTLYLKRALENAKEGAEENLAIVKIKNPILVLILSIFVGWLGIDRFVVGDIGLGICKLLFSTLTLFIWPLIDILFSYKKAKEKNLQALLMALS